MARASKRTITGITSAEAQEAANTYAKCSIKKDKLKAQLDEKLAAIRSQFEPQLTDLDAEMEAPFEVLHNYSLEQREGWNGKSVELSNCVIGFRTNPPSVTKKRSITWDAVVMMLKGNKILKTFVKTKEDVDKSAILKAQQDAKVTKALQTIGVTIEQDEQFYVDPKKEAA